jgi:hypothetical protein
MSGRYPLLAAAALVLVLGVTAFAYAAQGTAPAPVTTAVTPPAAPKELVVPDVRRQAYVFAKGILEGAGFAWKVQGGVKGFAANQVASQHPAPGTRVVDTGTPLVTLTLARNGKYGQDGTPEDASPYAGTKVVLVGAASVKKAPAAKPKPAVAPKTAPAKTPAAPSASTKKTTYPQNRPPAFTVPGAPPEPLDEMPLVNRVQQLDAWLTAHPKVSPANVDHWLFQHSWVVTGARFGWWQGAEALRLLVRVDERAQKLWGVGTRSAQLARRALGEVEARGA